MDKCGHAFTSYYEGVIGIEMMKWAGLPRKKAIWIGGLMGTFLQTPIEILDGFSAEWGASPGDLIANTTGSALCISQALLWDEQRIWMKFSYAPSDYAQYRPNALGSTFPEKLIKDYNAQTYWLSVNLHSFLPKKKPLPGLAEYCCGLWCRWYARWLLQRVDYQRRTTNGLFVYTQVQAVLPVARY